MSLTKRLPTRPKCSASHTERREWCGWTLEELIGAQRQSTAMPHV